VRRVTRMLECYEDGPPPLQVWYAGGRGGLKLLISDCSEPVEQKTESK